MCKSFIGGGGVVLLNDMACKIKSNMNQVNYFLVCIIYMRGIFVGP